MAIVTAAGASTWNSLEVAKLLVSALTPVAVVSLGLWVNRLSRRLEASQWANQAIVEWRMKIYDELASRLNDLLCYFTFVGNWKELTPPEIVNIKRVLDKRVYTVAPLFSDEFRNRYDALINSCFETYVGGDPIRVFALPPSGVGRPRETNGKATGTRVSLSLRSAGIRSPCAKHIARS
jgi:hypothetical protein